uniref:Uncharacterized protein n=1 Tax=Timema bartmani TaxID=61472 RepID=A0A7R9I522_9NEOP|nr:unnamed protein product [Timema bartmani]
MSPTSVATWTKKVYPNLCGGRVKNHFGNSTISTTDQDLNFNLPIVGILVSSKSSALDTWPSKRTPLIFVGGGKESWNNCSVLCNVTHLSTSNRISVGSSLLIFYPAHSPPSGPDLEHGLRAEKGCRDSEQTRKQVSEYCPEQKKGVEIVSRPENRCGANGFSFRHLGDVPTKPPLKLLASYGLDSSGVESRNRPDWGSNPDLPVLSRPVYNDSDALEHSATKDLWNTNALTNALSRNRPVFRVILHSYFEAASVMDVRKSSATNE